MFGVSAVGEVKASDIKPCANEFTQHLHAFASWSDGAYYLGFTHLKHPFRAKRFPLEFIIKGRVLRKILHTILLTGWSWGDMLNLVDHVVKEEGNR